MIFPRRFFVFCLNLPKDLIEESFNVSIIYRVSKNITDKRRGAGITVFLESFVSHGTAKKPRGTLLCFTKSLVTKFSRIGEWGGEEGSITICLTMPKTFVGELVSVSTNSGIEKIHA